MVFAVLLFSVVAVLVAVVMRPKLAAILVWPVILLYPHAWWYKVNPLPMNVGFDDLFISYSALTIFIRRCLAGGMPPRLGWTIKIGMFMLALVVVSNTVGMIRSPVRLLDIQIREALKLFSFILLAFVLLNAIDDLRDLRRVMFAFVTVVLLAAALVVYSYYDRSVMRIFTSPFKLEMIEIAEQTGELRATGSLAEPNNVGAVMAMGLAALVATLQMTRSTMGKAVQVGGIVVMLLAVLLSGSRTGFLCLAIAPAVLLFWRGMRKLGLLMLLTGVVCFFLLSGFFGMVFARFQKALGGDMVAQGGIGDRVKIWMAYLQSIDVLDLLLGQGQWASVVKAGTGDKPHSGYLNLLCYYGLPGLTWGAVMVFSFLRRARRLRQYPGHGMAFAIGRGASLFMVMVLVFAITAEPFSPAAWAMELLLAMMAFMDRADQIVAAEYWTARLQQPATPWEGYHPYPPMPETSAPAVQWRF